MFKICSDSKYKNLVLVHKSPILFGKYLGCLKSYRIGSVFKICVWISVFRRKKQFVNPLYGSKVTKILLIQENSGVFFETPCILEYLRPTIKRENYSKTSQPMQVPSCLDKYKDLLNLVSKEEHPKNRPCILSKKLDLNMPEGVLFL